MKMSIKIIVGTAIVAAAVAAASFGASAPAAASEARVTIPAKEDVTMDVSARKRSAKRQRSTSLRVSRLSRRAAEPPDPRRPYYDPVPSFYPFAQGRGYF